MKDDGLCYPISEEEWAKKCRQPDDMYRIFWDSKYLGPFGEDSSLRAAAQCKDSCYYGVNFPPAAVIPEGATVYLADSRMLTCEKLYMEGARPVEFPRGNVWEGCLDATIRAPYGQPNAIPQIVKSNWSVYYHAERNLYFIKK